MTSSSLRRPRNPVSGTPLAGPLCIAACIAACSQPAAKPLARPEHVLLLVIDTQRADHLSCYGNRHPTTPTLDALAKEGVLFEHAVSQCSWTSPSMVSMMTSSYVAEEGMDIPGDKVTLAETFRQAGFATGAFICNDLLSPKHHFDRGFDEIEWELHPYGPNDPIVAWIQKTKDQRSFTYVHLNEVHDPYEPPPAFTKWRNTKDNVSADRARFFDTVDGELKLADKAASISRIDAEVGGYDDDTRYSDERIRGIFDAIKAAGIWDKTAILVGADHGEGLWTRVQFMEGTRMKSAHAGEPPSLFNTLQQTHGSQVNWELVHVPLILKSPGLEGGRRVGAFVENVDIGPTLFDLCGLAPPKTAQGKSLVALARDADAKDAEKDGAFTFTRFNTSFITQDGLHLIAPTPRGECDFGLEDQLYDVIHDPEERVNLLAKHREVATKLTALSKQRAQGAIRGNTSALSARDIAALATLGYLGTGVVDTVRDELLKLDVDPLIIKIEKEYAADCLMRLQCVRALEGRELTANQRVYLHDLAVKETSQAVRDAIEELTKQSVGPHHEEPAKPK